MATSPCGAFAPITLDALYESLATTGGRHGDGLAPKTVLEVHMIVRAALDQAVERELVGRSVAHASRARRRPSTRAAARTWNAAELGAFLGAARGHRLYDALYLAAHTGMRRGEIVGLKWSDLDRPTSRLSISRTLQNVGGRPVEFGVKTRTSRRTSPSTSGRWVSSTAGVVAFDAKAFHIQPG